MFAMFDQKPPSVEKNARVRFFLFFFLESLQQLGGFALHEDRETTISRLGANKY